MKILDDLLSALKQEAMVKDVRQGPFQTAVLTRRCGLASTPHDHPPHRLTDLKPLSTLITPVFIDWHNLYLLIFQLFDMALELSQLLRQHLRLGCLRSGIRLNLLAELPGNVTKLH